MSNNPPKDADHYIHALEALKGLVSSWSQSTVNHDNAGQLRDLIGRIKELAKEAEKDRKKIKEPYLEQGKKIDAAFKPVATVATSLVSPLGKMLSDFLAAEEARKRVAAEKAQREAEAKARAAKALEDDAFAGQQAKERAEQAEQEAKLAVKEAQTNNVSGFESGRAMGLRTYYKARVVNPAMLVGHFADHPDVLAVCERLANAKIRGAKGTTISIPGIEVIEEKRVA